MAGTDGAGVLTTVANEDNYGDKTKLTWTVVNAYSSALPRTRRFNGQCHGEPGSADRRLDSLPRSSTVLMPKQSSHNRPQTPPGVATWEVTFSARKVVSCVR